MSEMPDQPKKLCGPLAAIKEIEEDPKLIDLCSQLLPPNYDFEIGKTIWRIRKIKDCKAVALQMPEGLLIFATKIGNILKEMAGVDITILGDVTYGACCVDDFTASMLGVDLLVHYGHSCLVPTSVADRVASIYIFVSIKIDVNQAAKSIKACLDLHTSKETEPIIRYEDDNFETKKADTSCKVTLVSTIQFAGSLHEIKKALVDDKNISVEIPRASPLSMGEILGCTSPKVDTDVIVYVGDGRFHLESMMMANPSLPAYRYDPYNKVLTKEELNHRALHTERQKAVDPLIKSDKRLRVGFIQGTLGRQGNPKPIEHLYERFSTLHDCFVILMSEVVPSKLALFGDKVDIWIQFACPRLSLDWGSSFPRPILSSYEASWGLKCQIMLKDGQISEEKTRYDGHPMDYYSYNSSGPHTPNFSRPQPPKVHRPAKNT